MKITPRDIKPPVWRRVQVKDGSLGKLHDVFQVAVGWTDSHLHAFEVGGVRYGRPDPTDDLKFENEDRTKLSRVVAAGPKQFTYTYDFGDGWDHIVLVEKILAPEAGVRYPRCVAGKRACPPEDCGGPWGYPDFLAAVQNPSHPDHASMVEWVGGPFDPEQFVIENVNKAASSGPLISGETLRHYRRGGSPRLESRFDSSYGEQRPAIRYVPCGRLPFTSGSPARKIASGWWWWYASKMNSLHDSSGFRDRAARPNFMNWCRAFRGSLVPISDLFR